MRIPVIRGLIDRRMLINYRVDPETLARRLPAPFRPALVRGWGMAGICLIRLEQIGPRWWPRALGLASENAAHRIAVEWDEQGETRRGVYIPRRDSSSWLNRLAGGSVFPGLHHRAHFEVHEHDDQYRLAMRSDDGAARVLVEGRLAEALPPGSVFRSLAEASAFFEAGSLGYSATARPGCFDGLELQTFNWQAAPLAIDRVESSYFENPAYFPAGSIDFDSALLMRGIEHQWHSRPAIEQAAPIPLAT